MKRLVVVLPLFLGWFVACSSSSGSGDASSASGFGQEFCQLIEPCCADAGLSTSGSQCQLFVGAAESKGTYDPNAGQACLTAMQQASKSSTFCTDLGGDLPQCDSVFGSGGGSAGPGQPCTTDNDCAKAAGGSAICFTTTNFVDGGSSSTSTCVQTQSGMAGQGPCIGTVQGDVTYFQGSGNGAPPSMGYTCNVANGVSCSSTTQKCTALAATGQPCESDQECVTSDYCAFGGTGSSTCQARAAVGAMCGGGAQCATTAYCDSSSSTCKALLPDGTACATSEQCQSSGCNNGKCTGSNNLGLALLCGG